MWFSITSQHHWPFPYPCHFSACLLGVFSVLRTSGLLLKCLVLCRGRWPPCDRGTSDLHIGPIQRDLEEGRVSRCPLAGPSPMVSLLGPFFPVFPANWRGIQRREPWIEVLLCAWHWANHCTYRSSLNPLVHRPVEGNQCPCHTSKQPQAQGSSDLPKVIQHGQHPGLQSWSV